ncbi:MAG TPA: hypothetical protein VKN74_05225 [Candidatus Mcinerneyibacterium sp.]|nr:hypothetical protein [Candidatus Mcinerneyibacterium sp.]
MKEEFTNYCAWDGKEHYEKDLEESHDIPTYLFPGETRNERKQYADKQGRHWLCKDHHHEYEMKILMRCLEYLSEEISPEELSSEKHLWMREIARLDENIKKELRKIAQQIKEEVFENGDRNSR